MKQFLIEGAFYAGLVFVGTVLLAAYFDVLFL